MNTSNVDTKGLNSKVWKAITGNGEDLMPPYPNAPLTPAQKATIQQWIEQGAANTTCTHICGCDSTNVSFSAYIAPVIQTFCIGCHSNTTSQGGVNLQGYTNVLAQVNNGKLIKTIKWQTGPGIVAMPYKGSKLSDCTISKFQSWVNAGSLNN